MFDQKFYYRPKFRLSTLIQTSIFDHNYAFRPIFRVLTKNFKFEQNSTIQSTFDHNFYFRPKFLFITLFFVIVFEIAVLVEMSVENFNFR